ncbi:Trdmt1 [Symbiodinium natans]|uniref:Trdmt1 protein n=1 Tax=Symbiodinium natans TaxID=878477 RepID=A0A812RXH9_9DINO|nr:Trdmt1 [Symbiodinium natans]
MLALTISPEALGCTRCTPSMQLHALHLQSVPSLASQSQRLDASAGLSTLPPTPERLRPPASQFAVSAWLAVFGALYQRTRPLRRRHLLEAFKVDSASSDSDAAVLLGEILGVLRKAKRPLHLTELGSAVEWSVERRQRHGRFASFVRRQRELWVSGGVVGEAKLRAWPSGCQARPLTELRVVELFSGIGGFRAAFHRACAMAGFPVDVGAPKEWINFEASKLANEVYSSNFGVPYAPLLPKDVRRLQPSEVDFADLWILSPPCQPYTRLGRRADLKDRRALPLQHLASLLTQLEQPPQAILLENVVGFEASESFSMITQALLKAHFEVRVFQLSPLQLGIPNRRPRIYLLARQSEEPKVQALEEDFPGAATFRRASRPLAEYLQRDEDLDPATCSVPLRMLELLESRSQRWEVVTPKSTSSSTFTAGYTTTCFEAYRFGPLLAKDEGGGEYDECDECRPVMLPGGRVKRLVMPGEAVRFFTPHELLQIAGFPSSFIFPRTVTPHQRYKLIGDSVNVDVVAQLLRFMIFEWTNLGLEACGM